MSVDVGPGVENKTCTRCGGTLRPKKEAVINVRAHVLTEEQKKFRQVAQANMKALGYHDPIAYIYEADHHCESCAEKRFGRDANGDITGTDSEGNEVGIISPWDDSWADNDRYEGNPKATLVCGTCGKVIEELDLT